MRHGAVKAKWQMNDELSREFYQWLQEEIYPLRKGDGTYAFATDIISLRKRFEERNSCI